MPALDLFSNVIGERRGNGEDATPDAFSSATVAVASDPHLEPQEDVITDYDPGTATTPAKGKRNGVPFTNWENTDAEKAFSADQTTAYRMMFITNQFRENILGGSCSAKAVYNMFPHVFTDLKQCKQDLDNLAKQNIFLKQGILLNSAYSIKPIMDWPEMHRVRFGFWNAGGGGAVPNDGSWSE
jgi:hypothetical protein